MNKDTTAALRELAEKWVHQLWALGADGFYHPAEPYLIDDLTVFINEHYVAKEDAGYPKEFTIWCITWIIFIDGWFIVRSTDVRRFKTITDVYSYWSHLPNYMQT